MPKHKKRRPPTPSPRLHDKTQHVAPHPAAPPHSPQPFLNDVRSFLSEGRLYAALALLDQSRPGLDPLHEALVLAECDYHTGFVLHILGHYKDALVCYDQAYPVLTTLGTDVRCADCDYKAALSLAHLGHHQAALVRFDRTCPLFDQLGYPVRVAECDYNAGVSLAHLSYHQAALVRFDHARPLFTAHGTPLDVAQCDYNAGACLFRLGQNEEALVRFDRARSLFATHGTPLDVARCDRGAGDSDANLGHHQEALVRFDRARSLFATHGTPLDIAGCDFEAGVSVARLGLPQEALVRFNRARALFAAHEAPLDVARCDQNAGVALSSLRRLTDALARFTDAALGFAALAREDLTVESTSRAARIEEFLTHPQEAAVWRTRAAAFAARWRRRQGYAPPPLSYAAQQEALQGVWGFAARAADPHTPAHLWPHLAATAYALGQIAKGAAYAAVLAGVSAFDLRPHLTHEQSAALDILAHDWGACWDDLQHAQQGTPALTVHPASDDYAATLRLPTPARTAAAEEALAAVEAAQDRLWIQASAADPALAALGGAFLDRAVPLLIAGDPDLAAVLAAASLPRALTPDSVRAALGPSTALLEIVDTPAGVCLFLLGPDGFYRRPRLLPRDAPLAVHTASAENLDALLVVGAGAHALLAPEVLPWRSSRTPPVDDAMAALAALGRFLLDDDALATMTAHAVQTLYVAPDAALWDLPLAPALSALEKTAWTVAQLPQGAVLAVPHLPQAPAPAVTVFVGYANLAADASSLPAAAASAPTATASLGRSEYDPAPLLEILALDGPAAFPSAVREAASSARLLVLAGHGVADSLHPHRSGLLLAGGPFTAEDVLHLRLPGSVVVLLGCHTAIAGTALLTRPAPDAEDKGAFGLQGLVRSFLLAGARAVVASTAPVDELAASLLLDCLQTRLQADPTEPVVRALAAAQDAVRALTWKEVKATLARWRAVTEGALDAALDAAEKAGEGATQAAAQVRHLDTLVKGAAQRQQLALGPSSSELKPLAHPAAWAAWVCFGPATADLP